MLWNPRQLTAGTSYFLSIMTFLDEPSVGAYQEVCKARLETGAIIWHEALLDIRDPGTRLLGEYADMVAAHIETSRCTRPVWTMYSAARDYMCALKIEVDRMTLGHPSTEEREASLLRMTIMAERLANALPADASGAWTLAVLRAIDPETAQRIDDRDETIVNLSGLNPGCKACQDDGMREHYAGIHLCFGNVQTTALQDSEPKLFKQPSQVWKDWIREQIPQR
jgi:hypothetical protein